jgi:alpha-mannosidase
MRGDYRSITKERISKSLNPLYLTKAPSNIADVEFVRKQTLNLESCAVADRPLFPCKSLTFTPVSIGHQFTPAWSTHWMKVSGTVPQDWDVSKFKLVFLFDSNCEAAVYSSDGTMLQGLTGGRDQLRVEYDLKLGPGETVFFYVEVAANELFGVGNNGMINPPNESASFALKEASIALVDPVARALRLDMKVMNDILEASSIDGLNEFIPSYLSNRVLAVANECTNVIDKCHPETFERARSIASTILGNSSSTTSSFSLSPVVSVMGHCHIDTAWLWPVAETRRKVARSWSSQLKYLEQDEYKHFKFVASQSAQYEMLKEDHPEVFKKLLAAISSGQFVPVGSCYVEPDLNMPSGESLVRQLMFGDKFFQQGEVKSALAAANGERGVLRGNGVFWLPDTFGYSPQIPQLIRDIGMRYFMTTKLSWSAINKPTHSSFFWRGLDGTSVLAHLPPANTYNGAADVQCVLKSASQNLDSDRSRHSMLLFGHGDGGGGPTPLMFEQLQRLGVNRQPNLPSFPIVRTSTPREFFDLLAEDAGSTDWNDFVTFTGELYLELHQGTLTSQANIKKQNRRCERALAMSELFGALNSALAREANSTDSKYPSEKLEENWKKVLLLQFHDILPGSSIEQVYVDAEKLHLEVLSSCSQLSEEARDGIVKSLGVAPPSSIGVAAKDRAAVFGGATSGQTGSQAVQARKVFRYWNPTPYGRTELVAVPASDTSADTILIAVFVPAFGVAEVPVDSGIAVLSQIAKQVSLRSGVAEDPCEVGALMQNPAVTSGLITIREASELKDIVSARAMRLYSSDSSFIVDCWPYRTTVCKHTGRITSMLDYRVDPKYPREVFSRGMGNRFVISDDVPFFWDAWDVPVYHEETSKDVDPTGVVVTVTENGPLRSKLTVHYPTVGASGRSSLKQDIIFTYGSPSVEFDTTVSWFETHKLLRVKFDCNLSPSNTVGTYETQFGVIERPAQTNSTADVMKFENCGHRFADVSNLGYGLALLNDCKYGYQVRENWIALSLLRSPKAPDEHADMGTHTFRYAILPHAGAARSDQAIAAILAEAALLNSPLVVQSTPSLPVLQLPRAAAIMARTEAKALLGAAAATSASNPAPASKFGGATNTSASGAAASATSAGLQKLKPPTKFRSLSFFSLSSAVTGAPESVVLDTVKVAEAAEGDDPNHLFLILRLYESSGRNSRVVISSGLQVAQVEVVNILEETIKDELADASEHVRNAFSKHPSPLKPTATLIDDCSIELNIHPFQVATLKLKL